MISKKKGVIVLSIVTLLSFISIVWVSCSKQERNKYSCQGIICANGGFCGRDTALKAARCFCPQGYEGPRCASASATKYVDTWDVEQKVIGSDSANCIGKDTTYIAFLKTAGTPTTFFIDDFYGDATYNDIICTIDSVDSHKFHIDTLSAFHMLYNTFRILPGSGGDIVNNDSEIKAVARIRRVNTNVNWQIDTVYLTMKRHQF